MEGVWQRNYANHAGVKLDVANYIAASTTASACVLYSVLTNLPPSEYKCTMAEGIYPRVRNFSTAHAYLVHDQCTPRAGADNKSERLFDVWENGT